MIREASECQRPQSFHAIIIQGRNMSRNGHWAGAKTVTGPYSKSWIHFYSEYYFLYRITHESILSRSDGMYRRQLPGPRKVYTPPERLPMPHRHVEYQPNLRPYPRQYINLGKLGPDPDTIRARVRLKQLYIPTVAMQINAHCHITQVACDDSQEPHSMGPE